MSKLSFAKNLPIALIGVIAILWYYYCVFAIGFHWPIASESFREYMSLSVSTLGGTLATFVGMIFGVQTVKTIKGNAMEGFPLTVLQWLATIAYVVSLIVAMFAWYRTSPPNEVDPVIIALAKSFLGLVGGVLVVGLNTAK
jgi:hypothetical protein